MAESGESDASGGIPLLPRTVEHRARMAERRRGLAAELERILPPSGVFVFELGCGHGHFLDAYAAAHSERVCVGIDISSERIERALKKRDRGRRTNLHFLRAEARLFLEVLPTAARFSDVFVLFPDPWPKLRHHKHRIIQPDFLTALGARMEPAARLCFRTDFEPYFVSARETIGAHPRWRIVDETWPFEYETVFQSRAPRYHSLVARPRFAEA